MHVIHSVVAMNHCVLFAIDIQPLSSLAFIFGKWESFESLGKRWWLGELLGVKGNS